METKVTFAPLLSIRNGVSDLTFYAKAFNATEVMRFSNDDGALHVAELSINGTIFHVHEQMPNPHLFSPDKHNGTTVTLGLFVDDVHAVFNQAVAAGAVILSPVQDYDYGYRQGELQDPFGHHWVIQKKI
ncbi:VOC family protein [Mucilaginibacter sp.]|uniref:VOC family protein n=1 Tax=Mucilaginibacter sp. TaxID=1882438 RepID=UPI003D0A5327